MSASELRRVVELSGRVEEEIRRFRDERIGKILAANTPIPFPSPGPLVVLHSVPLAFRSTRQVIPIQDVVHDHWDELKPLQGTGTDHRYNLDGVLRYTIDEESRRTEYFQLFRTGAVEAVSQVGTQDNGTWWIPLSKIEDDVVSSLARYLQLQEELGVDLPIVLVLTLAGVEDAVGAGPVMWHSSFDRNVVRAPELILQSYEYDGLREEMKPAFDALWQAGGYPESQH